jgi:hypothetical protein
MKRGAQAIAEFNVLHYTRPHCQGFEYLIDGQHKQGVMTSLQKS